MTEWKLVLPYHRPPLNLNDRMHWAPQRRTARELRQAVCVLARSYRIPPCGRVAVQLHYRQKTRRRIDGDNLVATVKPCVDGLRDAGVIVDDDTTRVVHLSPVVHPPIPGAQAGAVWLTVKELP